MLLAVLNFAAQSYSWSLQEIYDTPMLTLMLLMRQKLAQEGKAGISLQDKEILDNTSWDELLRRNREALYKQLNSLASTLGKLNSSITALQKSLGALTGSVNK